MLLVGLLHVQGVVAMEDSGQSELFFIQKTFLSYDIAQPQGNARVATPVDRDIGEQLL